MRHSTPANSWLANTCFTWWCGTKGMTSLGSEDNVPHLYPPHLYACLGVCVCVCVRRVCFPVQLCQLPRESQLTVTLYASTLPPPGGVEEKGKQRRSVEALGWVTMPLFSFRQ